MQSLKVELFEALEQSSQSGSENDDHDAALLTLTAPRARL